MNAFKSSLVLSALLLFLGCGGSEEKAKASEPTALASVRLASQPSEAYQSVRLFVKSVEVREGQDWSPLATPHRLVDFKDQAAASDLLAEGRRMNRAPGHQFRVRLAPDPGNTVTLADGASRPLHLAEAYPHGLIVALEGRTSRKDDYHEFALAMDLARSIQRSQEAGGAVTYRLRPALLALDRLQTGSISGKLLDEHQAPLAGVLVTAQEPQANGPVVRRTARTGADGAYTLDLLPFHRTYHVVSLPLVKDRCFAPQASKALALKQTPLVCDLNFSTAAPGQPLLCRVPTPGAPGQQEVVEVLKKLPGGPFVIRTILAEPGEGCSQCLVENLPQGADYQARLTRLQITPQGGGSAQPAPPKDCAVKTETTRLDL